MRNLTAVHLAASVALALSATVATAQTSGAGTSRAATGAATAPAATSSGGTARASTSTNANTSSSSVGSGVSRVNDPRNTSLDAASTRSGSGAGTTTTVPGGGNEPTNQATVDARSTDIGTSSAFARGGPFATDSGNSALGQSPGQTSAGTASGNSAPGIDAGSATLGTDTTLAGTAPGGVAFGTGAAFAPTVAGGIDVNGQRGNPSQNGGGGAVQQSTTVITTPILDQTVRQAQAREQRRRNAGQTPRIIGIAPNTDADLSHQMPDDRIIRY
jgi:hypothetical protein